MEATVCQKEYLEDDSLELTDDNNNSNSKSISKVPTYLA